MRRRADLIPTNDRLFSGGYFSRNVGGKWVVGSLKTSSWRKHAHVCYQCKKPILAAVYPSARRTLTNAKSPKAKRRTVAFRVASGGCYGAVLKSRKSYANTRAQAIRLR